MRKDRVQRYARWILTAALIGGMTDCVTAGSFARECAARDRQILMLIEDRENANAISAETSMDSLNAMMHARMICHEGRVLEALSLYDSIAERITSNPGIGGRM